MPFEDFISHSTVVLPLSFLSYRVGIQNGRVRFEEKLYGRFAGARNNKTQITAIDMIRGFGGG
jgi:hypothetical protein